MGYSPWGCKESDTTEQLRTALHQKPWRLRYHLHAGAHSLGPGTYSKQAGDPDADSVRSKSHLIPHEKPALLRSAPPGPCVPVLQASLAQPPCALFKGPGVLHRQSGSCGPDSPQVTHSGRGTAGPTPTHRLGQALRGPGQEYPYPISGISASQGEDLPGQGYTSQCPQETR